MASPSTLTRRALLGAGGAAALAGTVAAWPRLTGADIPGRGQDALTILILGTSQDAAGRQAIADAFMETHPDIPAAPSSALAARQPSPAPSPPGPASPAPTSPAAARTP